MTQKEKDAIAAWGGSIFTFEKKHVDTIYEYLLLNKCSIAVAFECYPYEFGPEHRCQDVVRLIEKCAYAIRDGVKTSDEYWANLEQCKLDRFNVTATPKP